MSRVVRISGSFTPSHGLALITPSITAIRITVFSKHLEVTGHGRRLVSRALRLHPDLHLGALDGRYPPAAERRVEVQAKRPFDAALGPLPVDR